MSQGNYTRQVQIQPGGKWFNEDIREVTADGHNPEKIPDSRITLGVLSIKMRPRDLPEATLAWHRGEKDKDQSLIISDLHDVSDSHRSRVTIDVSGDPVDMLNDYAMSQRDSGRVVLLYDPLTGDLRHPFRPHPVIGYADFGAGLLFMTDHAYETLFDPPKPAA